MSPEEAGIRLIAVIVLYKQAPEESAAFRSLRELLESSPQLSLKVTCLLFDNSPAPGSVPPTRFRCLYTHHPENPGLALAYQTALEQAHAEGAAWLMLLDQDTALTSAYLEEVLSWLTAEAQPGRSRVGVLAPKLLQDGDVLSPHWPLYGRNLGSFLPMSGLLTREVAVYNSGAVLRTQALREAGGFPQAFPLDYLDHVVFRQLQRQGWHVWLLQSTLEHHLASKHGKFEAHFSSAFRLHSILRAQSRFYRGYGSAREKMRHALQRSRMALRLLAKGQMQEALMVVRYTLRP